MAEHVRAWHPEVPGIREVLVAEFDRHAYPAHTHDDWTVLSVTAGAVVYDLDHRRHIASPAALTLLPPGVPHDGRSAEAGTSFRKRVLYLSRDWIPESARDAAAQTPTLEGTALRGAAAMVHRALQRPDDLLAAESGVLLLGDLVRRALGEDVRHRLDPPLAARLRELLDASYTRSVTLADAAQTLGAHPTHLVRAFSRAYGIAPHRYVTGRRVDLARRLLARGWAAADAAAEAGFHDQSHMARHFRRVLGASPGVFRERAA